MRIGIDAFVLTVKRSSGIPNYLRNILSQFLKIDRHLFFLYNKNFFNLSINSPNILTRYGNSSHDVSTSYGNTIWLFTKGIYLMKKDKLDIFWGPRQILPIYMPPKIKKIVTIHDLVWIYYPQTMEMYNKIVMQILGPKTIQKADHIITVSNSTANSIIEHFNINPDKITVVYHGCDQYKPLDKKISAEYIANKYKISSNYILTVCTLEPRKNLKTILEVFKDFKKTGFQFVIAGAFGWKYSKIMALYNKLGFSENQVKFLGYVQDEDMNKLYSGAILFVFPSIYEGFGLPPLEAMASGTPVIVSNSSSLPEIVGDAGILVNPFDIKEWKEAILKVLSDSTFYNLKKEQGLKRAKNFTWQSSASKILDIFEKI